MKRLITIIAVLATVLASCSKSEPETFLENVNNNANEAIKLDISVSGFGSDGKAFIKTDWVSGDQLLFWFDASTGETPDMVIKYNGSKWELDGSASVSGNQPKSDGYLKVLYNNMLVVAAKDRYSFYRNVLSSRIQTWTFLTEIQVVVADTNIKSKDANKYTLSCDKFTPFTGYSVGADAITATAGPAYSPVRGISNSDGVAFVFASCTSYNTSTDFSFTLNNGEAAGIPVKPEFVDLDLPSGLKWATHNIGTDMSEGYGYYFFWGDTEGYVYANAYSLTNTLTQNTGKINAIKIDRGKFSSKNWVNATNGEKLTGGFCWANAPFNGGQTAYSKSEFEKVRGTVCPEGTLISDYDAAYAYYGEGYRMPTAADYQELIENTDNASATYNGIWGWLFTSKADPSKKVFIPNSGNGTDILTNTNGHGYILSSSLKSDNYQNACILHITHSSAKSSESWIRGQGYTIRAVSD